MAAHDDSPGRPADPGLDVSVARDGSTTVDLGPFWDTKWSPVANEIAASPSRVILSSSGPTGRIVTS